MHLPRVGTFVCAGTLLLASVGLGQAQTTTGGMGNTGNDTNNPAVIQNDATGTVVPNNATGTMMDNSGAVQKPGKNCGMRGENQGTTQTDAQANCE
jgi:hypothetical protein